MTDNTLEKLLLRLQQGDVTRGWGAILAFSRDQVNGFLAQQHIEGLDGLRFLLPYTESFFVNDDQTEEVELRGIVLGTPSLSFEKASLNKSALTMTMNIVAGTYSSQRRSAMAPPTVLTAFAITEDMGFHVKMQADLGQAYGEVDKLGRVTLDLSIGEEAVCNLGSVQKVRERIGEYFQRYFAGQPEKRRRFTLGTVKLNSYNPLSPTAFAVRTQPAPGAADTRSATYGDGAIVVFVRLKIQDGEPPAGLPIEGSGFPYLIPSDLSGGAARYSAALLVARQYLPLFSEDQIDALRTMMFPGNNVFVESTDSRYDPYDRVLFGNVTLKPDAVFITPTSVELGAGNTQQFRAVHGDGSQLTSVEWSVSSPDYPLSTGTMAPDGIYTATAQANMHQHRLPLVVTARYQDNGMEKRASALVHERFESLNIAPLIQIKDGEDPTPITLHATTASGAPLDFRLLEPALGARLEAVDENHQLYYPPATLQAEPLVVQRIVAGEVGGDKYVQTSILLVNQMISLATVPHYVTGLLPGDTVQIGITSGIDPARLRWTVLDGGGTVQDGLYTAPADRLSPVAVVMCELPEQDPFPALYGYSVINLQPVQNQAVAVHWEALEQFIVEAPGGLAQCYANGNQQVPVKVTLETMAVQFDGQSIDVPVSDVELGTLRLVDEITQQVIPVIDPFQDGIAYGSGIQWASRDEPNRFSLFSAGAPGQTRRQRMPQPTNNRTRYRQFFVHMAVEGLRSFYAEFQAQDGSWWRSNDEDIGGGKPTVEVQGVKPPTPDPVVHPDRSYDLVRERVFSGEGNAGEDGQDDFNYFLDSVDYWRLSYKKPPLYPVAFSTLEMEGNVSTIQWESEYLEETFFSYTGFAFYPQRYRGNDEPPAGLSFDVYYRMMLTALDVSPVAEDFPGDVKPSPGELIFSLHRVPDMPYWHDGLAGGDKMKMYREHLDPPVVFVLLDEEGNRHRLQVSFPSSSIDDSRNQLKLSVQ
jgi:hypothetical protein